MCACVHTSVHMRVDSCKYACMCVCAHVCTHVHIHGTYMYAYLCTYMYMYMYAHMYASICACVRACVPRRGRFTISCSVLRAASFVWSLVPSEVTIWGGGGEGHGARVEWVSHVTKGPSGTKPYNTPGEYPPRSRPRWCGVPSSRRGARRETPASQGPFPTLSLRL